MHGAGPQITARDGAARHPGRVRRRAPAHDARRARRRPRVDGRGQRELCAALGELAVPVFGDTSGLLAVPVPPLGWVGDPLPVPPEADPRGARRRRDPGRRAARRRAAERERGRRGRRRSRSASARAGSSSSPTLPGLYVDDEIVDVDRRRRANRMLDAGALRRRHRPEAARGRARRAQRHRRRRSARRRWSHDAAVPRSRSCCPPTRDSTSRSSHGEGSWLVDAGGRRYLDLFAGIAVVGLGHRHPAPLAAAQAQLDRLWHVSNLYCDGADAGARRRSCRDRFGGAQRVLLQLGCRGGRGRAQVGAQGNRPHRGRRARRLVPRAHVRRAVGHRSARKARRVRAARPRRPVRDAGHARRRMSATGRRRSCSSRCRAKGGVRAALPRVLAQARALADEHGALLVLDEVQTGVGRTRRVLRVAAATACGRDAVTLAKGLANGLPIGALLVADDAPTGFEPGDHASTFGGNPVACAAACAVLDTIDDALLARVRASLRAVRTGAPCARARPAACPRAREPGGGDRAAALERGLVIGTAGDAYVCAHPTADAVRGGGRPCDLDSPKRSSVDDEVRAAGDDPAPRAAAAAVDTGRGGRGAARERHRGRAGDRLTGHHAARPREGAQPGGPARLRAAGRRRPASPRRADRRTAALGRRLHAVGDAFVIATPRGFAAALADAIDAAGLEDVAGTIAGDNTVFVAARDGVTGAELADELRRHLD